MTLAPELENIRGEAEQINERARDLCGGLDERQLAWRPEPGRWSIAENLIHLRTTAEVFMPALDAALEKARRMNRRSDGPFRLGMMGRIYRWYVEPPPVIRLPAPKPLHPILNGPAVQALPLFLESQEWVLERVRAANGFDLNGVHVVSPLAKFIRMDLLTIFNVFTGHTRRHIWQANNVRQALR